MENNQRNSRKRLNSFILLVAFTAVMLIVSTYAWFSTQKNVTIKALEGKVRVDVKEAKFVVPVGAQRVVVAVPEEEEIEEIQYMGQGCVDYKDMFEEEVIEGHRVMTYIFAVPCSAKMTFKIILK